MPEATRNLLLADEDGVSLDPHVYALMQRPEQIFAEVVHQRDAGVHQCFGPEIRVAAGDGRLRVEYGGHTDRDQRVGRDTVDVHVVDDRDVTGAQATDQALGTPVKPYGAADRPGLGHPGAAQRW